MNEYYSRTNSFSGTRSDVPGMQARVSVTIRNIKAETMQARRVISVWCIALFCALLTTPVLAQYTTSSIGGTVTDDAGNPVANASVKVAADSITVATSSTDANGEFHAPDLDLRTYSVSVTANGYVMWNGIVCVILKIFQIGRIARIGELVEIYQPADRLFTPRKAEPHKIGSDESTTACDQQVHIGGKFTLAPARWQANF